MPPIVGKFASEELRHPDEEPLMAITTGRRFAIVAIRTTLEDFKRDEFQRWVIEILPTRFTTSVPTILISIVKATLPLGSTRGD